MNLRMLLAAVLMGLVLAGGCGPARVSTDVSVAPVVHEDKLAQEFAADPVGFLEQGLKWYDQHVKDYRVTLYKLERVDPAAKDFMPEQKLVCKFKENPFSVFAEVVVNPRGAAKALYVEGQWDNKMRVPVPLLGSTSVDPRGPLVRTQTLRFIDQFGFKRTLESVLHTLKIAQAEKIARIEVVGAGQVGGRDVLIFEYRVNEPKPTGRFEFPHLRIYLDREWRLALGVDVWDPAGIERGRYRFEDIKFNVGLTDADFTLKANGM